MEVSLTFLGQPAKLNVRHDQSVFVVKSLKFNVCQMYHFYGIRQSMKQKPRTHMSVPDNISSDIMILHQQKFIVNQIYGSDACQSKWKLIPNVLENRQV